ncbi:MAG: type II secretion system F family protein [Candidatus Magasanikbacteria bacterium]|nr:type II secretion system F family protein [Candidatus Magasanikbacteria bacterium]
MKKKVKRKSKKKYNKKSIKRKLFLTRILISKKEKNIFIENFSLLYGSGMGISKILSILKKESKTWAMKFAITYISRNVDAGESLWKTFQKTNILSEYFISLVKMGEESGTMAENLNLILEQQRKEQVYNSKIRSAMLYPSFVISLTLVIGLGTAFFVLPRLTGIFTSLGVELPLATRILIGFSNFITEKGSIFFPILIITILLLFFFLFIYKKTNFVGFWMLFKTPGISKLIQYVELARMGYFLGTLLEASVPILKSLDSLSEASKFNLYSKFYKKLHDNVKNGLSIEESFKKYKYSKKLIPVSVQALIIAGEQSGKLGSSLIQIGKKFDAKIETTTKNLSVMLEPILLVIVWMGVLLVALAVILPIYNLVAGVGSQNKKQNQPTSPPPISTQTDIIETMPTETSTTSESTTNIKPKNLLEILPTGTGFLNVRSTPSLNGGLIEKVEPTDTYIYSETENGWYKITLDSGETGWVLGTYITILE